MQPTKLEIGGENRPGWLNLDHKKKRPGGKKGQFNIVLDELPVPDGHLEFVYMSNVLEHILLKYARTVLSKLAKKIKVGGILRLAVPDLHAVAVAYVNNDAAFFEAARPKIGDPFRGLGVGGLFMSSVVSYGSDTFLFDHSKKRQLAGLAHVGLYDFTMLNNLCCQSGFSVVNRSERQDIDHPNAIGQLFVEAIK